MKHPFNLAMIWGCDGFSAKSGPVTGVSVAEGGDETMNLGIPKTNCSTGAGPGRTPRRMTSASGTLYILARFFSPSRSRCTYPGPPADEPAFSLQMITSSSPSSINYPQSPRHAYVRPSRLVNNLSSAAVGRRRSAPSTPREVNTRGAAAAVGGGGLKRAQQNQHQQQPSPSQSHYFKSPLARSRPPMTDAATQYSPPTLMETPDRIAREIQQEQNIVDSPEPPQPHLSPQSARSFATTNHSTSQPQLLASQPPSSRSSTQPTISSTSTAVTSHQPPSSISSTTIIDPTVSAGPSQPSTTNDPQPSPQKRARRSPGPPDTPSSTAAPLILPRTYTSCPAPLLVRLISSMLTDLITHNDTTPHSSNNLTRFHSRAPPSISVHDYLSRLTTHATLSPPILLSMVYYIDKLCALWPRFTINSLTVHRYLIASATVASKGLSDAFWTNHTYARVGGVSLRELAMLELEFVQRIDWRIVPRPEVLEDYYVGLVERGDGVVLEGRGMGGMLVGQGEGEARGKREGKRRKKSKRVEGGGGVGNSLVGGGGGGNTDGGASASASASGSGNGSGSGSGSADGSESSSSNRSSSEEVSSGEIIAQLDVR